MCVWYPENRVCQPGHTTRNGVSEAKKKNLKIKHRAIISADAVWISFTETLWVIVKLLLFTPLETLFCRQQIKMDRQQVLNF